MDTLTQFSHQITDLVSREAEATRRWFHEQWSMPVAERAARGRCLDQLKFLAVKKDRFLVFQCDSEHNAELREGDLVRLSRGDPMQPLLSGSLHRVDDVEIWLDPETSPPNVVSELEGGQWVLDRSYLDLETFYRAAVKDLGETVRGIERILPLLAGEREPETDLERFSEALDEAEKEAVNESQTEAVAQSVATDLCHLVQGPPGTGKTFVLAQIVKQRAARGERILVTAATHQAIHNALNMIRRIAPEIRDVVKIGQELHAPDLDVPQYESFTASPLAQCEGGYVVGATPFAARSRRLRGVDFDVVIIDEAGQVTLPLAVMAMLAGDSYILVGDHRQLPPVVQSLPPREAHFASVFGRLSSRGFHTMLEVTYRMNAELVRWPGEAFYSGKLRPAPANAARRLPLSRRPANLGEVLDPERPLTLVELDHCASRRHSDEEATLAADLLVEARRAGLAFDQIGVVVPFRRQARRIRTLLRARRALLGADAAECVIDTVERLQGQERELVIVSMTASDPDYVLGLIDFLLRPQRLNVAVTRARSKVILLASEQLALADPIDPDALELVSVWKSLREASHVIRW